MPATPTDLSPVLPAMWLLPSVATIGKTLGILQERLSYTPAGREHVATLEAGFSDLLEKLVAGEDVTLELFDLTRQVGELQKSTAPLRAEELTKAA